MRLVRELAPKMSDAISAMVIGLHIQNNRDTFTVDMETFGDTAEARSGMGEICFGCAATCAAQQLAKINLDADIIVSITVRAAALDIEANDLAEFELAIDSFRKGHILRLMDFYDYTVEQRTVVYNIADEIVLTALSTLHWKDHIGNYMAFAQELKARGL